MLIGWHRPVSPALEMGWEDRESKASLEHLVRLCPPPKKNDMDSVCNGDTEKLSGVQAHPLASGLAISKEKGWAPFPLVLTQSPLIKGPDLKGVQGRQTPKKEWVCVTFCSIGL